VRNVGQKPDGLLNHKALVVRPGANLDLGTFRRSSQRLADRGHLLRDPDHGRRAQVKDGADRNRVSFWRDSGEVIDSSRCFTKVNPHKQGVSSPWIDDLHGNPRIGPGAVNQTEFHHSTKVATADLPLVDGRFAYPPIEETPDLHGRDSESLNADISGGSRAKNEGPCP